MIENYIKEGIKGYLKEYSTNIIEIISNRNKFKELIYYLKENCGIKYIEIMKFFELSRGIMDSLKKK